MRVNDLLRMELMAECLGKRPAFLVQESPWSPSSSTILPRWHFVLSKILAPVQRAIAIRSSSRLSKFPTLAIGNASDYAAVWLCCAASNRQWFHRSLVFNRVSNDKLCMCCCYPENCLWPWRLVGLGCCVIIMETFSVFRDNWLNHGVGCSVCDLCWCCHNDFIFCVTLHDQKLTGIWGHFDECSIQ